MPTDIFSQISDGNGHMVVWRFAEYLQEVLALPAAVYESPSFNYTEGLATSIFAGVCIVTYLLLTVKPGVTDCARIIS
jgi:hypothetical protein